MLANGADQEEFFLWENQSDIAALLLQEKPDVQQTSIYILTEKFGCEHSVNVSVSDRGGSR